MGKSMESHMQFVVQKPETDFVPHLGLLLCPS